MDFNQDFISENMFTLLYGFYKYLIQKDEFCVLILGLDNAGKTVSEKGYIKYISSLNKVFILKRFDTCIFKN